MAQLRDVLVSLGHEEVTTYIQSGNAIITSERTDEAELMGEIEAAIDRAFGFEVTVVLRTPQEIAAVMEANPFVNVAGDVSQLYVAFLSAQPDPEKVTAFDAARFAPDEFAPGNRAMYLRYVNGAGRTKLTNDVLERQLGVRATARNWNTVTKLLRLAGE